MHKSSLIYIVLVLALFESCYGLYGPRHLAKHAQRARKPREEIQYPERYNSTDSQTPYKEAFFSQVVDHFNYGLNSESSLQWRMRYLYSDQYWGGADSLSPIFLYCGNEGDIDGFWNNSGNMVDILAPQYKAYLLFPEHRYFGKSLPFGSLSMNERNLVYLTADQALADYVVFIRHYKTEVLKCPDCPVIAFGGSYGGMLASWMRMKYPNSIDGALACSAPILYFNDVTPQEAFFSIASWDFGNVTEVPQCAALIKEGFNRLDGYIAQQGDQYKLINQIFNTCTPLTSNKNISAAEDWLANGLIYMAMVDYPYPTSFLTPLPGSPVNFSCQAFIGLDKTASDETLITALFKSANIFYNYENATQCSEIFDESSGLGSLNEIAWNILACTEVILPMGSNGVDDIWPARPWSYEASTELCRDEFSVQSRYDWALNIFGGWDVKSDLASYSNIFFSNGVLDPWHAGGVLVNVSDTVVSYIIENSAHHLDLRGPHALDPPSVEEARRVEANYVGQWITEKQKLVIRRRGEAIEL